jgi:hypothetical protein
VRRNSGSLESFVEICKVVLRNVDAEIVHVQTLPLATDGLSEADQRQSPCAECFPVVILSAAK